MIQPNLPDHCKGVALDLWGFAGYPPLDDPATRAHVEARLTEPMSPIARTLLRMIVTLYRVESAMDGTEQQRICGPWLRQQIHLAVNDAVTAEARDRADAALRLSDSEELSNYRHRRRRVQA